MQKSRNASGVARIKIPGESMRMRWKAWERGRGHVLPSLEKNREKYFSGNHHVKFWHFDNFLGAKVM